MYLADLLLCLNFCNVVASLPLLDGISLFILKIQENKPSEKKLMYFIIPLSTSHESSFKCFWACFEISLNCLLSVAIFYLDVLTKLRTTCVRDSSLRCILKSNLLNFENHQYFNRNTRSNHSFASARKLR